MHYENTGAHGSQSRKGNLELQWPCAHVLKTWFLVQYWADTGPSRPIESWRPPPNDWMNLCMDLWLENSPESSIWTRASSSWLIGYCEGDSFTPTAMPSMPQEAANMVWNPKQLDTSYPVLSGQTQACLSDASWLVHLPHSHPVPSVYGRSFFGARVPWRQQSV